jgi:hypothetical protein
MKNTHIPKIIHHIAPKDTNIWHPFWHRCRQSWLDQFPDYEHKLWNDQEDIDNLVKTHYSKYWNLYQMFPVHIMRIDFARLCILHQYGGIYSDMDYYCYKNFELDLQHHDIYLVENLTEEYTNATVENSLMAAVDNNKFFLDTMAYVQACFIQFRNKFKINDQNNWRNPQFDFYINNTTGSGMLSVARDTYGQVYYNISHFNTAEFNNRPSAYADFFKAKHVHTSLWGEDQTRNNTTKEILIVGGNAYTMSSVPDYAKQQLSKTDYIVDFNSYNFYTDYTHNKYLQQDNKNLDQIKIYISESEQRINSIMTTNYDTKNHQSNSTS